MLQPHLSEVVECLWNCQIAQNICDLSGDISRLDAGTLPGLPMPASLFAAVVNRSRFGFRDESFMRPSHGQAATASGTYRNQWVNRAAEMLVNFVLEYRSWHPVPY
jgi:hypothetical protein